MAREAEEPDSEQQLLLRRRLFSAEERSFRMDRRSPPAAALHAALADALPRCLGSYYDEILVVTPTTRSSPLVRVIPGTCWRGAVGGGVDALVRIRFCVRLQLC
jgi:hypothetical protein